MYEKTEWKARKGSNLNRFEKSQETNRSVILTNAPSSVTEPGTPFSANNMNKIEQGIFDAHEMLAREEQARKEGDIETLAVAKTYTDNAQLATQTWLSAVRAVADLPVINLNKNINYLCRVIADPDQSKNGVYQCIAGWEDEPVWTYFSDNADWVDENEMSEFVSANIDEHNKDSQAHEDIRNAVSREATERAEAISAEAETRAGADISLQQAINAEAQTRATADQNLQTNINNTTNNLQTLQDDFNAWIGRGGYLNAFNFGTAIPSQEALTSQALSQIASITDPLQIWNGTKILNLFNNILWVLTNTQDTDPPVFEWAYQGTAELAPFTVDMGGYIVGANPEVDPPEYVQSLVNGKGKIDLDAIKSILFDIEHPVGDIVVQYPGSLSPIDKGWGTDKWKDWTKRASMYRLRSTALPGYTTYTWGANYAVNAVVMWHLDGDDYAFFQAKEAITNASEQLDPVKWNQLKTGVVVERKNMLDVNPWGNSDLTIGQKITGGAYNNYYVEEIIVYGGKFFAAAGGNRPPFVSGGVQGDRIRNIAGGVYYSYTYFTASGVFKASGTGGYSSGITSYGNGSVSFSAENVVPTGSENSPRTLSVQYWRRVS
jgi:hypothetical protein